MFGYTLCAAAVTLALVPVRAAPVPKLTPEQVRQQLNGAWADLLSADEQVAGRALLRMASSGDLAVEYLKREVRPLLLTKERAETLIADLGSGDEKKERAAFEELSYFDPRLALGYDEILDLMFEPMMRKEQPAARKLSAVLLDVPIDALQGERFHMYTPDRKVYRFNCGEAVRDRDTAIAVELIGTAGRKATWVRLTRAVVVLEFVGGDAAREALTDLAKGHADAAPTKAAKAALARLKKQ